jgi:hypothetical protein
MDLKQINTIDEVIVLLENIIIETESNNDVLGYFAALYQKVTIKVKEGILSGFFDDGSCMEQLDVAFAMRYLQAYDDYRKNRPVTESWKKAFEISEQYWPIVLQHLLMGMNAHINLDLGIAAAKVSRGKNLDDLRNDFNRINEILSALVHEVEGDLSAIWPILKYILKWTGQIDDYLVDFSMKLARDGAWKFASQLVLVPEDEIESSIAVRDSRIADKVHIILQPGLIANLTMKVIRLTERGSVSEKIQILRKNKESNY